MQGFSTVLVQNIQKYKLNKICLSEHDPSARFKFKMKTLGGNKVEFPGKFFFRTKEADTIYVSENKI